MKSVQNCNNVIIVVVVVVVVVRDDFDLIVVVIIFHISLTTKNCKAKTNFTQKKFVLIENVDSKKLMVKKC